MTVVNYQDNFQKHSKTFSFASKFFGKKISFATSRLYYFFRKVDDLADEENSLGCDQRELEIYKSLQSEEINDLKVNYQLPDSVLKVFIDYAIEDISLEKIELEEELLQYCYGVASTVGLCMCHILDVKNKVAFYHAIDLGIAMQLTNICRDVFEDYKNGRIYLPELAHNDFINGNDKKIERTRVNYLKLAEKYYESGYAGLIYLPFRSRFVIFLAAKLYQKIGSRILIENDYRKRAYLSRLMKIVYSVKFSFEFLLQYPFRRQKDHNKLLHRNLAEMPYVNQ